MFEGPAYGDDGIATAFVPDGIRSVTALSTAGEPQKLPIVNNVATGQVKQYAGLTWTTATGESYTREASR
jgi:hypothetical protein